MGASQKQVEHRIQEQYKPLRRYHHNFYGEVTVMQHIPTGETVAKVEKAIHSTPETESSIDRRLRAREDLLVRVRECHRYHLDLCSGEEMHVFILDYHAASLHDQIVTRHADQLYFDVEELTLLFTRMIQCINLLRAQKIARLSLSKARQTMYSSSSFLYVGRGELKTIEPIFCNKNNRVYGSAGSFLEQDYSQHQQYYISPESYELVCRGEILEADRVGLQEGSIIFSLGMTFIQCALLADLHALYNKKGKKFEFATLRAAQQSVRQFYGQQIHQLVLRMTEPNAAVRPSLSDIQEYLGYICQVQAKNMASSHFYSSHSRT